MNVIRNYYYNKKILMTMTMTMTMTMNDNEMILLRHK